MKETYTKKEANRIVKEVKEVSYKLSSALDNQTWTNYWSNLVDREVKEERHNRGSAPDGVKHLCSMTDSAKLLCAQWIIGYTLGLACYYPKVDDFLHTKKNCFEALALALTYTDNIIEALDGVDIELIMDADYCGFTQYN